jgi:hypothetical protein
MAEPRRHSRLAQRPPDDVLALLAAELLGQQHLFHGDLAVEGLVVRAPHNTHTASSELLDEAVPIGE